MADAKLSLKLLVDKDKNKVVFAESQRDFVDVLFSILTLPLGTIIRLLNKQTLLGCMDRLYESVEKLDLRFMETKACKSMLLRPRSAAEHVCEDLKLGIDDTKPRTGYRCPTWGCYAKTSRLYSPVEDAKCPCGLNMDSLFLWLKKGTRENGVFVKGEGGFTISDNLHVIPSSTDATLSILQWFGVNNRTVLEEMSVEIGEVEMLYLLNRSLLSDTPLTDVFLRKLDISRDADELGKDQVESAVKCEAVTDTCKKLKLKLVLSKSTHGLLYAEAGGDVVDFLFSFLTFPVGSIIKLLHNFSCMGCLDNLYNSVEQLIYDAGRLVNSTECTTTLLSPKLAHMFACSNQLLSIQETVIQPSITFGCWDCFNLHFLNVTGTECKHGIEHVTIRAVNPKLPSLGTESGGGFTKGQEVFMITDELEVTPLSSISSSLTISRLKVPLSDLVVREVILGESEGLKLLKASLTCKRVLSTVFCNKKRKNPPACKFGTDDKPWDPWF